MASSQQNLGRDAQVRNVSRTWECVQEQGCQPELAPQPVTEPCLLHTLGWVASLFFSLPGVMSTGLQQWAQKPWGEGEKGEREQLGRTSEELAAISSGSRACWAGDHQVETQSGSVVPPSRHPHSKLEWDRRQGRNLTVSKGKSLVIVQASLHKYFC